MTPAALAAQGRLFLIADLVLAICALAVWSLTILTIRRRWGAWPVGGLGPLWQQLLWGGGLAGGALAAALAPGWLAGGFDALRPGFTLFQYPCNLPPPWFGAQLWGYFLLQSLYEELIFRGLGVMLLGLLCYWLAGLVLKPEPLRSAPALPASRAWERRAWFWVGTFTCLVVSLAFAWAHRHNPNLDGFGLSNIALAGLALGLICWWQGHPLGAWALHWVWNAAMASLGLPVSGILISPPLIDGLGFVGARPGLLTGGSFGPEGSLSAVLALAAVCGVLWWRMWRSVRLGPAAAAADPRPESEAGATDSPG